MRSVLKNLRDYKITKIPANGIRKVEKFLVSIGGQKLSVHNTYEEAAKIAVKHSIDPWYYDNLFKT